MEEKTKREFMEIIESHYSDEHNLQSFVPYTRYREFAMMTPKVSQGMDDKDKIVIRCLNFYNHTNFKYYFKNSGFRQGKFLFNLYSSVGWYMKPSLSWIGDPDRKEKQLTFKKEGESKMMGYDFVVDIDCDSEKELRFVMESAKKVFVYFIKVGCPFTLKYSGLGVHFVVPYEFFKNAGIDKSFVSTDFDNIYKFYYRLAYFLQQNISEMVDATIYDSRRILKLYGSLAIYDEQIYLCNDLPLGYINLALKAKDPASLFRVSKNLKFKILPQVLNNKTGTVKRFCQDAKVELK